MPIDTIRDVETNNLIEDVNYLPSRTTRIKYISSLLTQENEDLAVAILEGKLEPSVILDRGIDIEDMKRICDIIIEYIQHKYLTKQNQKKGQLRNLVKVKNIRNKLAGYDENYYKSSKPNYPKCFGFPANIRRHIIGIKAM